MNTMFNLKAEREDEKFHEDKSKRSEKEKLKDEL